MPKRVLILVCTVLSLSGCSTLQTSRDAICRNRVQILELITLLCTEIPPAQQAAVQDSIKVLLTQNQ